MVDRLTIGTAVYDDFDGLYFTIQAIRFSMPDRLKDLYFVVVDNNPLSDHGKLSKKFCDTIDAAYVPFDEYNATSVKGKVFDYAKTDYVLYIDSHVLLQDGSIDRLLSYINYAKPDKQLIHGVLYGDNGCVMSTHMDPVWRGYMLGTWGKACRDLSDKSPAFDIPGHGMGLFCCNRHFWPGFNSEMRGFGGEEGYIHEKVRMRGGRVVCLPGLRWMHKFKRVEGAKYPLSNLDKCRNYIIGFRELGLKLDQIAKHFGPKMFEQALNSIHVKNV